MNITKSIDKIPLPPEIKVFFKDKRKRNYVVLSALSIFCVVYLVFFIAPLINHLLDVSRSVRDLANNIEIMDNRIARSSEMNERLSSLKRDYARLASQIPAEKEISLFLQGLAVTARDSNVVISSVTPGEMVPAEGAQVAGSREFLYELPVVITAKSGYHQLGRFVNDLERDSRFLNLQDIRVTANPQEPAMHSIYLSVRTYVLKE